MKSYYISLLMVFVFHGVHADLQIVVGDETGQTSTFSSNGKQTRMDDSKQPGYVLIDHQKNQVSMVDQIDRK